MNEVTKIHLGRQAFTISVDAYTLLQAYLQEIKRQVGSDGKDVVEEVELRMVELLAERKVTGGKVILKEDIIFLKEQLGEPGDFKDEDSHAAERAEATETPGQKRFFRDAEHGMVAGVAAGLAAYTGLDVLIIRLVFIFFTFAGGVGIFVYLLLWILAPQAKTGSDRLQMAGKAVTVDSIKRVIREVDVPGAAHRVVRHTRMALGVAGAIVLGILGITFMLGGAGIFVGAITVGGYILLNGVRVLHTVIFPFGPKEVTLLICVILLLALIALGLVLSGAALLRRKWSLSGWVVGGLVALFVSAMAITGALSLDAAPRLRDRVKALHHSRTVSLANFSVAKLNGAYTHYVFIPDPSYSVEVDYWGDKPVLPTVKDGVLTIDTSETGRQGCGKGLCLYTGRQAEVTIKAPSLTALQLDGEGVSLDSTGLLTGNLTIDASKSVFVGINNARAERVVLTDGLSAARRQISLYGLGGQYSDDYMWMAPERTEIGRTNTLEVKTDGCYPGSVLAFVRVAPQKLIVNGAIVESTVGFDRLYSKAPSAYNCIAIEQIL
jgi:phage shock protein PspC (stress-responsive transcriptional regulator)